MKSQCNYIFNLSRLYLRGLLMLLLLAFVLALVLQSMQIDGWPIVQVLIYALVCLLFAGSGIYLLFEEPVPAMSSVAGGGGMTLLGLLLLHGYCGCRAKHNLYSFRITPDHPGSPRITPDHPNNSHSTQMPPRPPPQESNNMQRMPLDIRIMGMRGVLLQILFNILLPYGKALLGLNFPIVKARIFYEKHWFNWDKLSHFTRGQQEASPWQS